ncbi:MAG: hypothetical protein GSR72_01450 [Desulfurococcales archaeon]|nr:hypothetical protein [Desulfurococcales archaeon]
MRQGEALSTEQALQDYARLRGDSEAARTAEEAAARYISEADDILESRSSPTRSILKGLKESLICGAAGALAGTLTYTSLTPAALTGITLPTLTLTITETDGKITSLRIGSLTIGTTGQETGSPGTPANTR